MKINNCHIYNPENVGDILSVPLQYFNEDYIEIGIGNEIEEILDADIVIFGGGGMLYADIPSKLNSILKKRTTQKMVLWGIGDNTHGQIVVKHPDFLQHFDVVGLRDFNSPYQYVPCASCLHNSFVIERNSPIYDFIIYEHKDVPIFIDDFPKMDNRKKEEDFDSILDFLSSGECIITNTFHGAYWGLMLNRKVLIYKPFSSRFYGFKHQPFICNEYDWFEKSKLSNVYPNYLSENINLNIEFFKQIFEKV